MGLRAALAPAAIADLNMRISLKRIRDEALKRADAPIATILDVAIRTIDARVTDDNDDLAIPGPAPTTLVTRNVRIDGRRTSVKLEPDFWENLEKIANGSHATIDTLCSHINRLCGGHNLTSAIRVFVLLTALQTNGG